MFLTKSEQVLTQRSYNYMMSENAARHRRCKGRGWETTHVGFLGGLARRRLHRKEMG